MYAQSWAGEKEDTIKLFLWTVTNLFPAFHNCVCRSHIRIWYRCHVPSPCHIRHVSRVSVRKSALLPSNIHIQWCSLTAIRLSDTGTRRALCNQLDCYSNCHGTCCCNCELIQILRIHFFVQIEMRIKWLQNGKVILWLINTCRLYIWSHLTLSGSLHQSV